MHLSPEASIVEISEKCGRGNQQKNQRGYQKKHRVSRILYEVLNKNKKYANYDVWDVNYLIGSSSRENHPE